MDNVVFKKTEVRKNIMAEKHMKWHAREKSIYGKSSAYKKQQKKTGETVNTVHISSDFSTNLPPPPPNTEKKAEMANKKLKKKSKSKSSNQRGNAPDRHETRSATDDDDVIIVGESTKQTNQTSKEQ